MAGLNINAGSQDRINIASDGTQLAYQASIDQEASLTMALDDVNESLEFSISGADVNTGDTITTTIDLVTGQFVLNNKQGSGGEYNLKLVRATGTNNLRFWHSDIPVLGTDTHYIDYAAWDGVGSITIYIDHNSDGTIDETIELDNEPPTVYLPLIMK